jgi:hypothetical protein
MCEVSRGRKLLGALKKFFWQFEDYQANAISALGRFVPYTGRGHPARNDHLVASPELIGEQRSSLAVTFL